MTVEEDEELWKAFSLTHVEYPKGSLVGLILAIFSLIPFAIISGFVALVIFRRDLRTITFFLGILLDEGVNSVLKRLIAQPRPSLKKVIHNPHGMPSSHSQFMAFFTLYLLAMSLARKRRKGGVSLMGLGTVFGTTVLVMVSRVVLRYHSLEQVLVGGVVGGVLGLFWWGFTEVLRTKMGLFTWICQTSIAKSLLIRDTTDIEDLTQWEYDNVMAEAAAKKKKTKGK